jgi:RNA polymerase sigma-70 factor (ECF subfamily)
MSSECDRLLVKQIRDGDPGAWENLIARYEGRLLAFVERRLRDRSASEDVVQETFIGFLNSLPHFDDRRELQTYLFTIASHKLTDHLRRNGRHPLTPASEGAGDILQQQIDHHKRASSMARSHERKDLEADAVGRCLGQIIRDWQERGEFQRLMLLELLMVKGWANRDVAKFLRISEQQVANYRFAAVKKLTEKVRDAGLPVDVFPELRAESE